MFGYIRPFIPELKVKDKELYQAYYCGLCRALRKYGMTSRMTLTYDATFAAILLSSVLNDEPELVPHGCPAHPARGRISTVKPDGVLDYCAAVSVLLAKHKLLDDAHDGRPLMRMGVPLIGTGIRRAEKKYPEAARILKEGMERLYGLERAKEGDPDAAPLLFGGILGDIFAACPGITAEAVPILTELGRKAGGFVYIADAWDDRADDEKKGQYNIFVLSKPAAPREMCSAMLDMYINSAVLAYDLMDLKLNKSLLDNVMYMGLGVRAAEVLHGEGKSKKRAKNKEENA